MHVYLAADHAGFEYKEVVKRHLTERAQFAVTDCGAYECAPGDDYPDFISKAAEAVAEDPAERRAIIFGGSGQGEAMLANKFSGVRAAVYYGSVPKIVVLSREHNDANVLSLGARFITETEAVDATMEWLSTPFSSDERHVRRIQKLHAIAGAGKGAHTLPRGNEQV